MTRVGLMGAVLGVLSRIEEKAPGFHAGVSTNATWVAVAFVAGVMQARGGPVRAAVAGGVVLTVANAAYYALIGLTEPGVELASVAGAPASWFALGVAGGAVFALSARTWVLSSGAARVMASLPLSGVCIADGIARSGGPSGPITAAVGCAFPVLAARDTSGRCVAGIVSAVIVVAAARGQLNPLLP